MIWFEKNKSIPLEQVINCSLFNPKTKLFVLDKKELVGDTSLVYIMKNCSAETDKIIEKINDYLAAHAEGQIDLTASIKSVSTFNSSINLNDSVSSRSSGTVNIKYICFALKNYLSVPKFANFFVIREGIDKLKNLVEITSSNTLAYACECFEKVLEYKNACQYVEENEELFYSFYKILFKNKVNITKTMLIVFQKINDYMKDEKLRTSFYDYFYKSAEKYSREFGQRTLEPFVQLVADPASDIQDNVMLLIVKIIRSSTKRKITKIAADLKSVGLNTILEENFERFEEEYLKLK